MASERVEKRRASVPEDPGMDYSNDSDDSSGSRSASQIKRGGNNHFGSTGILKCLTCRKRKGKCQYSDPDEPCRFCSDRSLQCGTKLTAKGARAYELSQQLLSLQREAGMVPFPDTSKLSAIALELERRFPNASVGEIYAMAKPTVEGAVAVAAGGSRHDASILFGHRDAASLHQLPPRDVQFHHTLPLQEQRRPSDTTPTYDMESWFDTFPTTHAPAGQDFTYQQQHEVVEGAHEFYSTLQRHSQRRQPPQVHTDEGDIDYSSLFP